MKLIQRCLLFFILIKISCFPFWDSRFLILSSETHLWPVSADHAKFVIWLHMHQLQICSLAALMCSEHECLVTAVVFVVFLYFFCFFCFFFFFFRGGGGGGWGGNFIIHKVCRFCCYLSYISLIHFNSLHQFMYCLSRNQRLALNSTDVFFYCDNFTYMFRPVILQSSRWHFCYKNTVWSDGSHWATVLKYIECRLEFSVCWYKIM